MANAAVIVGIILLILGLGSYFGTGRESATALIPAVFGFVMAALGFVGAAESRRKHAMHAAATLALLGLIGSARGVPDALKLAAGNEVARPAAAAAQAAMAVICLVFLILAVRSFRAARRAREAAE